jgi:signal transduction histidine kinase
VHEINTPIGSILSNNDVILRSLELLKKSLPDAGAERARDIVETCRSLASVDQIACERISSLIRSLKTYARVDSDERRKADLNNLLQAMVKLMQGEFRRRVQVELDLGDLPEIQCYPQMLCQVFLNLLSNAGQAIEGEGLITVRTRAEGGSLHVSVRDSGKGIPLEIQPKIFGCGFSTKPIGVGTGLGLAISRQIVEDKHGGRISFESAPGEGATFHVYIPIAGKEPA